jgi:broad specificity phosphatase PhoE
MANAMPNHLVLVRHGEAETNFARAAAKRGDESYFTEEFRSRPDYLHRLTEKGAWQAQMAGLWIARFVLQEFGLPKFDAHYCSTYNRPIETAGNLGLPGAQWRFKNLLRERDYGDAEGLTRTEYADLFPQNVKRRAVDPIHARPLGGESQAQVAETRVRAMQDTLARENTGDSVVIVTHGEFMWSTRLGIEEPLPQQWVEWAQDPEQKMKNCQVLHYSREDPETREVDPHLRWMRSVCPWETPDDPGEWHEFGRQTYTNEQMLAVAGAVPRLFLDEPEMM